MSLHEDINHTATTNSDTDSKFKRLEYLAFRGKWDTNEQESLARILGLNDGPRYEDRLCDYDRRLSSIETIYTFLTESKKFECMNQHLILAIRAYVKKYPASEDNIPPTLHNKVFSKRAERLEKELEKTGNEWCDA